ncbi:MAG: hypothetical protein AAF223_00390 [Bacteroidota bacterium]
MTNLRRSFLKKLAGSGSALSLSPLVTHLRAEELSESLLELNQL